jgi:hypothetical protein
MADDNLEEYARLENNHILLQLVGARPPTGEDPLALAGRNVTATEQSFGRRTALHAMALNTHAFALMYKGQNGGTAAGGCGDCDPEGAWRAGRDADRGAHVGCAGAHNCRYETGRSGC